MYDTSYEFEITTVFCDGKGCHKEELINSTDWSTVAKEIKENGWTIKKEDGDWCHYCSSCSIKNNE